MMVLVFNNQSTKIIKGLYDSSGLTFLEGTIDDMHKSTIINKTDELLKRIELEYGTFLGDWDGSMEQIKSANILKRELLIDKINKEN